MAQISKCMRNVQGDGLMYWCQGCNGAHVIYHGAGHPWTWDGNLEAPTFSPSVLIRTGHYSDRPEPLPDGRCSWCVEAETEGHATMCSLCHTFITAGMVQFLSDCTHQYAGQLLALPDLPPWLQHEVSASVVPPGT